MHIDTFFALTERMVENRTTLSAVEAAIPAAVRDEWYEFSTPARCEHGAQGVPAGFDSTREEMLPFAVRLLAGPVPVDFLFPETREAAKDAYRALCAEIGDPSKAQEQVADYEATYAPIHAGVARQREEWVALAKAAGLPVPVIPTEVFATTTRAMFDAAVAAVEALGEDMAAFQSAVDPKVVKEWLAFRDGLRSEFGMDASFDVPTKPVDKTLLGCETAAAAHQVVSAVPMGFLVEQTREQFKADYRSDYAHKVESKRDEDEHARLLAEAEAREAARREFYALGQRLGYVTETNTLAI